jgi:hypothetical protein
MSSGGGTTQTVQKSDPWYGVQPYLVGGGPQYIQKGGQTLTNQNYNPNDGGGLYGRTASLAQQPQNPLLTQSQDMRVQSALDPNSIYGQGDRVLGDTVSGAYLNPETNPSFKAAIQDALGQAASTHAGQFGGFAGRNLSGSGYQENLGRTLGSLATGAYANQYNTERQNQMQALGMVPTLGNMSANQLGAVGKERQDFDWSQLQKAAQIFGGSQGGTTTGQQPYTDNTAAQMAGLALMAYAVLSDRRLKSNIKRIRTHKLGFGVYEYDIFGRHEIGVMADEVEKVMPEAVVTMPGGYLGVCYDMIGGRDAL